MAVMITVESNQLTKHLDNVVKNLPKKLGQITWKVANQGQNIIRDDIASNLALTPKKLIKDRIGKKRDWPGAELTIYRKQRISLKYFKPKQHKKGVKVKVLKSAGRKLIPGAFGPDIAKLHGNVFKRKTKKRLPIRKLYGLSPWGAFRKTKSEARVHRLIEGKLRAEMIRVINYNTLKQSGA
jgi:hypothetical protein